MARPGRVPWDDDEAARTTLDATGAFDDDNDDDDARLTLPDRVYASRPSSQSTRRGVASAHEAEQQTRTRRG